MTADLSRLPDWLLPVAEGAAGITVHDLTRFMPPAGADVRRGAVLMLFGEGEQGPDLLLTERNREMRSHPGQVSFPGGTIDPGETAVEAALREAHEETGLDPAGVEVFGQLPELFLPPSNFAVTPVLGWWREPSHVSVRSPEEVHAVYRVPLAELTADDHRIAVRHPSGWVGPGFLIGDDHDVILWGFTGGIIDRLFTFLGWTRDLDDAPVHELPGYMLANPVTDPDTGAGSGGREDFPPNTEFEERRGR